MTFLELRTSILGYLNRPSSEMATVVNTTINLVLRSLQRGHQFQVCETLVKMTYPAGQYFVTPTLEGVTEVLRNIITVGIVLNSDKTTFVPVLPRSFSEICKEIQNRKESSAACADDSSIVASNEDLRRMISTYYFSFFGNKLVLYPTPSASKELLLHCSVFFPDLVADTDSNALTEAGADYVILASLRLLHIYMKTDVRYAVTDAEVAASRETLLAWDRDIRSAAPLQ